jgi:hypothetical protein
MFCSVPRGGRQQAELSLLGFDPCNMQSPPPSGRWRDLIADLTERLSQHVDPSVPAAPETGGDPGERRSTSNDNRDSLTKTKNGKVNDD